MSPIRTKPWFEPCFWLRAVLLSATFLGLIASIPLWLNSRAFPLLRVAPWFPVLPAPWDKCLFGAMLLALALAGWRYRPAVAFFLGASLFAYCEDQNRGQPWFYMYWVMLLLTLLPGPAAMAACRCSISVVYIWSGIQKINPAFLYGSPGWFTAPAANWHLPGFVLDLLRWGITTAPIVEIGIGLGLWAPRLRKPAIIAVFAVHLAALLFLGPLGHNYNWVVWPWNLAMIGLVCALFVGAAPPRLKPALAEVRRSRPAIAILAPYALLPALSFVGWWDSDFSFTLYAENQANANIFVTPAFAERLPPQLRRYVHPFPQPYDPQFQGPCVFMFGTWCYEELHVPVVPEPRNFRAIFRFLRAWSKSPEDLRLIIGPRAGPILFYQGDDRVELGRKP